MSDWGEDGFSISAARCLFEGRRRLDASVHNPAVAAIRHHLIQNSKGFVTVAKAGYDVWLPNRFRRTPATDGVLLFESAALTEVNPDVDKRIAEADFGDQYLGRVRPGWLLVARSGQIYGINGTAVMATEALAQYVVSDDVIRVAPKADCDMRLGYLLTALSHPVLGRPLVKSLAYGSSIPHIDPGDFAELQIVRLTQDQESVIADLAEASAQARSDADEAERALAKKAQSVIDQFLTNE